MGCGWGRAGDRGSSGADQAPPAGQGVLDTGKKLSGDNTIGKEEIEQRLAQFVEHWQELKQLAAAR